MENHPIPQDVTGFKFKIIGSMTIKQFGYVTFAGIFATVTFISGLPFFLKVPLMAAFGGAGVALAFVPVGGRPLDRMLMLFARSIPKENQFLYHKQGVKISELEYFKPLKVVHATAATTQPKNESNKIALASALRNSYFRPDEDEMQYFSNLKQSFDNPSSLTQPMTAIVPAVAPASPLQQQVNATIAQMATPAAPVVKSVEIITPAQNAPVPIPVETNTLVTPTFVQKPAAQDVATAIAKAPTPADAVAEIKKEIQEIKVEEQSVGNTQTLEAKIAELEKKLAEALGQTESYQQKVLSMEKQTSQGVVTPVQQAAPPPAQNVTSVAPSASLTSGFPTLPDIPNIVLGIVKDPRGKILPNILVEVVDKNEIPVRAFKTNTLGQFISATPLPNGIYKLYFDDPQKAHEFENVQIEMNGSIFNPIEILSVDQREKLRRDLFGAQSSISQPTMPAATPAA